MNCFEMVTTHSKQVLNRTMDGEETLSLTCRFESSHLPLLLPRWLMRSLGSVILILTGSVSHGGEDLTMGSAIASKLVCHQLPRCLPLVLQHFAEEAFGGFAISPARHQNVDHVSILIHRSPQIVSLALDRDEELVNVPDVPESALFSSNCSSVSRTEFQTPVPNRLVGDRDATLREQVFHVTKAESEPMVKRDGVADDFRVETSSEPHHGRRGNVEPDLPI